MKTQSIVALVLVLAYAEINAQALQRPGKIVDNNGDTISGMIIDRESKRVESIEFVKDGKTHTYRPADIRSFSTDRPINYLSMEVEYDSAAQVVATPPFGRSPNLKRERLFLEVVVEAPVALLFYVDRHGREHFFIKKDGLTTELTYRMYIAEIDLRDGDRRRPSQASLATTIHPTIFNEYYKQHLFQLGIDCPAIANRYKTIAYNRAALKRAIVALNKCSGFEVKSEKTSVAPSARKAPTLGVSLQGFTNDFLFGGVASTKNAGLFNGAKQVDVITDKPFGGFNFSAGAFYEIFSRRRPNRFSLFNELVFQSLKNTSHTDATGDRNFDFKRLLMSNAIRFSMPSNKGGRLYFSAGLNYGYRFGATLTNYNLLPKHNDSVIHYSKGFDLGYLVGFGKTWALTSNRRFTTEFRYSYVNANSKTAAVRTRTVGLSVQVPIF